MWLPKRVSYLLSGRPIDHGLCAQDADKRFSELRVDDSLTNNRSLLPDIGAAQQVS